MTQTMQLTQLTLAEVKDLLLLTRRADIKGNEALGVALLQQKLTNMQIELEKIPADLPPLTAAQEAAKTNTKK